MVYKPAHVQGSLDKMVTAGVIQIEAGRARYRITSTGQSVLVKLIENFREVPRLSPETVGDLVERHDVLSKVVQLIQV